mmetsp:Transcript_9984/g.41918  ORF Transcript_9984/g.41918 Transcript_9984/m.41918 type:complete len:214 (-) Transcript_9984:501-1142(-)
MSASASTSISTKRTRSRSYSSTTEASIGRTRAHGAHPSAPKNATNAFVSRGELPKKPSPAYRRLNASAPRWRTDSGSNGKTSIETSDVFCLRPEETSFAPGRMSESRSPRAKGDGCVSFSSATAARTLFAVSANAVVIAEVGRERGSVVLSVCGRSTGPCHRSAATPAAKPLPRATKAPGVVEVSVIVSFFSTSSSSAACIPRIVSETTSVRA